MESGSARRAERTAGERAGGRSRVTREVVGVGEERARRVESQRGRGMEEPDLRGALGLAARWPRFATSRLKVVGIFWNIAVVS